MALVLAVYVIMFLAIGVGFMIAIQAQVEYESVEPELGEIPENITIKRHRAEGWRTWS